MANERTGTVHGTTITLDTRVPALEGHRVRVVVESLPAAESACPEGATAEPSVLALLASLGPWEGETEASLQARLAQARREGRTRRVPAL